MHIHFRGSIFFCEEWHTSIWHRTLSTHSKTDSTVKFLWLKSNGTTLRADVVGPITPQVHASRLISQLYGSTTVVMAIYGLHWKWRSLTPCQRHLSEPIEKIFGTIDYVIDLNNLATFGFEKIFRDWGRYTQHIRVCAFFYNFLRS